MVAVLARRSREYAPGISSASTNQVSGGSFDANGNSTASGYTWDIENRLTMAVANVTWAYDPRGKRVFTETSTNENGATCEIDFYGLQRKKLAAFPCQYNNSGVFSVSAPAYNVYFKGKLIQSNNVIVTTDRLGSVRGTSNNETMRYTPYGTERTSTSDGREKWGTYFRDMGTGNDYSDQRYKPIGQGLFLSPDPGGIRTADTKNPGSWNRYPYSLNDPINLFDPTGKVACDPDSDDGCGDADDDSSDDGGGGGGDADDTASASSDDNSDQASQAPAQSNTQNPNCGPPQTGAGFGVLAGAGVEAGLGPLGGATAQGAAGGGAFINGSRQVSLGGFLSGGATAYSGNSKAGAPPQPTSPSVVGASAGYGVGVFFTNGGSGKQLTGPFQTFSASVGVGSLSVTFSWGTSNGVSIFSIFGGVLPYGGGLGLSGSGLVTTTGAISTSTCQ